MDTLQSLIDMLGEEEYTRLKREILKRNKREDVHNVAVLDAVKTYDINSLDSIRKKIGSNAWHALTKRLQDTVIDFIGLGALSAGASEAHAAARLVAAARTMLEHKLYKPAFRCLAKAESRAGAVEDFALLNDLYLLWAQYAHCQTKAKLDELLEKQRENREKLHLDEQLTLAYAVLRSELSEIYHRGKVTDLGMVITDTFKRFGIPARSAHTYKSLYQLLFIANEQASVNSDFRAVLPYIEESYEFLSAKKTTAPAQRYYRIYILYFMANACLRNRRFSQCDAYLEEMNAQMQLENARYRNRFFGRHALLRALCANYSGAPGNAEAIVAEALSSNALDITDRNDLRLTAAVFCLQHSDRTAAKHLRELMRTDGWYEKHMGRDWLIKKLLVEMILYAEFGHTELALARIKGFRRKLDTYLRQVGEIRVLEFLALIELYIKQPENVHGSGFLKKAEKLLEGGEADLFVLAFTGWLIAKSLRRPVYEVTLKLVQDNYLSPSHSA